MQMMSGYTARHLHQHIAEHKNPEIGSSEHGLQRR